MNATPAAHVSLHCRRSQSSCCNINIRCGIGHEKEFQNQGFGCKYHAHHVFPERNAGRCHNVMTMPATILPSGSITNSAQQNLLHTQRSSGFRGEIRDDPVCQEVHTLCTSQHNLRVMFQYTGSGNSADCPPLCNKEGPKVDKKNHNMLLLCARGQTTMQTQIPMWCQSGRCPYRYCICAQHMYYVIHSKVVPRL